MVIIKDTLNEMIEEPAVRSKLPPRFLTTGLEITRVPLGRLMLAIS
jgi:hypothetical protein